MSPHNHAHTTFSNNDSFYILNFLVLSSTSKLDLPCVLSFLKDVCFLSRFKLFLRFSKLSPRPLPPRVVWPPTAAPRSMLHGSRRTWANFTPCLTLIVTHTDFDQILHILKNLIKFFDQMLQILSQFYTLFNTNSDKLILIKKNKLQTFKDALFGSSKNSTYKIMCSYNLDICHIGRAVRSVSFIAI